MGLYYDLMPLVVVAMELQAWIHMTHPHHPLQTNQSQHLLAP